jgi:RNA polymerase sigma factor (sigma-70 family)
VIELTPRMLRIPAATAYYVCRRTGYPDPEEVECVAWEALGRGALAFDATRAREGTDSMGTYLVICCRRACQDFVRRQALPSRAPRGAYRNSLDGPSHRRAEDDLASTVSADRRTGRTTVHPGSAAEAEEALQTLLARLPPGLRCVLELALDGLGPREISRRVGISRQGVRNRLFRARRAARELHERGVI